MTDNQAKPDIPPGDVIFRLKTSHHDSFERSGSDLLANVKITLTEALLGFSRILITHLDGRGVSVSSPPGKIITPGQTIKLRGEGMPSFKNPDQKGDLYIVLEIEMPDIEWLRRVDQAVRSWTFLKDEMIEILLAGTCKTPSSKEGEH